MGHPELVCRDRMNGLVITSMGGLEVDGRSGDNDNVTLQNVVALESIPGTQVLID